MKLTADSLGTHLEQQLLPAYLICGDEPLLVGEAADAVRARARAAGCSEREVHFLERAADWNDVVASVNTLSLFATRRLVEIRMPSGKPGVAGSAAIVRLLAAPAGDVVLLLIAPRLDRDAQGAEWVRAVEAHGALMQVWPIKPERLCGWLRSRARGMQLELDDAALQLLADRVEGNLLAAHQELAKIRLLAPGGQVGADTVLASVADSTRFDVYQLSEAALAGEARRAQRVLNGLRSEGVEPTLALWALSRAVRDLANAQAGAGGRGSWVRPSAALDQGLRRAQRLSFRRLTERATRADRMIKGRLMGDPWDEIALLAAELSGRTALPLSKSVLK